jgi:hypothetical protein
MARTRLLVKESKRVLAMQDREATMCFSATGSFAISGVLSAVGAASIARNSSKVHPMFAAIPLVFAIQQAAEGIVWLTMDGGYPTLHRLMVGIFLGSALIVWPTWLSFALRLVERNTVRRRALGALFWMGSAVAIYAAVFLVRFRPVARSVVVERDALTSLAGAAPSA